MQLSISKTGVPAGVYDAEYTGGELVTTQLGEAYSMKFRVVGGDWNGKITSRLVNPDASSPKSNIAKFFAALAGVAPADGVNIDDEQFIGKRYQIVVEQQESGYTRVGQILKRVDSSAAKAAALNADAAFDGSDPF